MTTVEATMARSLTPDMFDDITATAPMTWARNGALTILTFDAELTAEQITAVRDRMTSRDDDDQAARAILRDADTATNRWKLLRSYVLGDPMPEPQYPEPTP